MITTADLKSQTRRDLAEMAKQFGVQGWHSMRKAELIAELTKIQRRARRKSSRASNATGSSSRSSSSSRRTGASGSTRRSSRSAATAPRSNAARRQPQKKNASAQPAVSARASKRVRMQQMQSESQKDLSASILVAGSAAKGTGRDKKGKSAAAGRSGAKRDRIVLLVRDSYWLQATWEITRASVQRARAAMAEHWHCARPVLRVLQVTHGAAANATEQLVRDIPIHGGVNNWYIDVMDPPSRFRVVIGYLADNGRFFSIGKSNIVQTPIPGARDALDGHWEDIAEDYERIYALSGGGSEDTSGDMRELFERQLRRPLSGPEIGGFAAAADAALRRERDLPFDVDAELIIYGSTVPGAAVSLAGEPVKLQPDGTFTIRMDLPDRRQVLPVVALSRDGLRQRTTVVAVERNTKVMEPVTRDREE